MARSLHKRIAELIDPVMMIWVLNDSFDHKAIVELCNSCSLSYEGIRTKSVSTKKLIIDLAEEFYKDDGNAKIITKALSRANSDMIKKFKNLSVDEIEDFIGDGSHLFAEDGIGNAIFALAADERKRVSDLIENLLWNLRSIGGYEDTDYLLDEEEFDEDEDELFTAEIVEENEKLIREIEEFRSRLSELEAQKADLEKKVRQFIDERRSLQAKIADLQRDLRATQKASKALEEENTKLVKKLERKSEPSDPSALLNQLIRENRKVQYSLEKLMGQGGRKDKDDGPSPFVEALGETISEVKDFLAQEAARGAQERGEIKKGLEEIRGEMRSLQAESRKLQELSGTRARRAQGDVERVGIFVDVQNIFYAAREFNSRVDFEKLLHSAVGDRRLIRAIAYVVQSPEVDQSGFITMLQQKNYEVKGKNLRLRSDGSAKGDWDMGIAIDIIGLADKLDVVVLVSGDGDFVSLVNLVKTMGPRVEVFSFLHNTAKDLIQAADQHYPIEEGLLLRMDSEVSYGCPPIRWKED